MVFAIFFLKNELPKYLPQKTNQPFSSLKKNQISEIVLTKDKTTHIYKKDKALYVKKEDDEFLADNERINKIIESFINLKKESVVSSNKNKHRELGIDKQKIELKTEEKIYVVYIGSTSGLSNNYVRINNEDNAFVAEGFNDVFTPDDYRDLSVHFVSDEAKITSIEIDSELEKIFLTKEKSDWKIDNKIAKKDRVDFFINDLKTLKAKDIFSKEKVIPVVKTLSIKIKEVGKEKTIAFYLQDENNYLAKTSISEYIYQIPAAYVASLKKEEKDFLQ